MKKKKKIIRGKQLRVYSARRAIMGLVRRARDEQERKGKKDMQDRRGKARRGKARQARQGKAKAKAKAKARQKQEATMRSVVVVVEGERGRGRGKGKGRGRERKSTDRRAVGPGENDERACVRAYERAM